MYKVSNICLRKAVMVRCNSQGNYSPLGPNMSDRGHNMVYYEKNLNIVGVIAQHVQDVLQAVHFL